LKKTEIAFAAVVLVLAAVVGGLIGDIVGSFLPEKAAVKTLFEKSIDIGLKSFNWELYTISFTFGLMVKINFVSILMIILVIAYFKWWHL
jgi:urea transporter